MPYRYEYMGRTITLEPDTTHVAVRFHESPFKPSSVEPPEWFGPDPLSTAIKVPGERFTLFPTDKAPGLITALDGRARSQGIVNLVPVFNVGGQKIFATERIAAGITDEAIEALHFLHESGCEILEKQNGVALVRIPESQDTFDMAERLRVFPGVTYAEPDFVILTAQGAMESGGEAPGSSIADGTAGAMGSRQGTLSSSHAVVVIDDIPADIRPMWVHPATQPAQSALEITRAQEAWALQMGDPGIVIAILDDGVDTTHPDLSAQTISTYDSTDPTAPTFTPNPWDGHGTACAGLAIANPQLATGAYGIGRGCSLMAIRIAKSPAPRTYWATTTHTIAGAIRWATSRRADVISCSWSYRIPTMEIHDAIMDARSNGRDGKGAVVVFAAGNDAGEVAFPANLPGVLAVSASNAYDEFKTPTSRDGQIHWGSNFGPEISVSAPGIDNRTTRIGGGYFNFNGTSSSCPLVAGAVGLVLSAAPQLTEAEARAIIMASSDKIEGQVHPYIDGRNNRHGHGRLNVENAVILARQA